MEVSSRDVSRIVRAIENEDYKKKKVAKHVGISRVWLTAVLSGRRQMSIQLKTRLFKFLALN